MRHKTVVSAVLLLFVAASVVYLVFSESRTTGELESQDADESTGVVASASGSQPDGPSPGELLAHKVVVYYFHGSFRCPTCRKFEVYADKAVESAFSDEVERERLEWRVVNVEERQHKHFVQDYELVTRSIVVAELAAGKQTRWKNLARIWDLVGDKQAFIAYVQEEVRDYLEVSE